MKIAHIFEKIKKFCFVKVSLVEEIASKFASADFQNFCRLASKKSAESAVFFGLEGTLVVPDGGSVSFLNFSGFHHRRVAMSC